jgi:hypothetical protein
MTAQCRPTDIYQLILLAADDLQVTEQQRRTIHKLLLYGPEYTKNPNYYSNAAWRNIAAALNILATATDPELSKAVTHALQLCLVAISRADTTASDAQTISAAAAMVHKLAGLHTPGKTNTQTVPQCSCCWYLYSRRATFISSDQHCAIYAPKRKTTSNPVATK